MIYFISDTHFRHKNILKFYPKRKERYGAESVYQMDSAIINEWNSIVSPDDTVYHLGDVAFCSPKIATDILSQLNGKIHLVVGNHDKKNLRKDFFRSRFESINDYLFINYKKQPIVLFHYPILSWHNRHRGSWHLHGHTHGKIPYEPGVCRVDVGIDGPFTKFPVSFDEIKKLFEK